MTGTALTAALLAGVIVQLQRLIPLLRQLVNRDGARDAVLAGIAHKLGVQVPAELEAPRADTISDVAAIAEGVLAAAAAPAPSSPASSTKVGPAPAPAPATSAALR